MRANVRWILIGVVALIVGVFLLLPSGTSIESGSVLVIDVQGEYVETAASPLFAQLLGQRARPLAALLSELAKVERDERLAALVVRVRDLDIGWAKAQEIRDAIRRVADSGKRTLAYLEVEAYGANIEFYVALAAEEVYLAPGTRAPLLGLAAEYFFLGGLWSKLGVEIEVERIGAYKSAAETLAHTGMSEAHREMAESLLDSIESQFVAAIADARDLSPTAVRATIDEAPTTPAEIEAKGLVDGVQFFDEIMDEFGDAPVVSASDYASVDPADVGFDPSVQVALVYGSGSVVVGEGDVSPGGAPLLASQTVSAALLDAAEDPDIAGVLLRIDSPGGSALASDLVWRATQKLREEGKPIVASFSDLAASGGYYVACGADAIVAEPGTLTGSIGVFVLRPVLRGLFDKLGIAVEGLTRGKHAELLLSARPLSPGTRERLRADVAGVYDLFVKRVAAGRGLEPKQVDAIGRGRVWTGAQAYERGLVDRLGGLREAVNELKDRLGLEPDEDVALVPYPPPPPAFQRLAEFVRGASIQLAAPLPQPLRQVVRWIEDVPLGRPVLVPPLVVDVR